jgi:hypothetical protein
MQEVAEGQVWKRKVWGDFYRVLSTTPRLAIIHSCDRLGRRRDGFTLSVRQSSLRSEYELHPK